MIGRTAIGHARQSLGAHLRPQPLHQGRLANARLTADEDDLPQPGFALVPAAAQQPAFLLPPHQHRHCGRHKLLVRAGGRQQATHTADRHGLCDPVERVRPQVFQGKSALHQAGRHGTNHHRVRRGEVLEPGRNVGRFPERQVLVPPAPTHHPHHDRAGVDAEPHGELDTVLCRQAGIQGGDGLDNAQAGVHRAPGLVFMGRGVAKIDQQPIAEILGDMTLVVLDDLGRGLLVGAHHGAQVFGVELAGELRGAHQVTEQHRELPSFRLRGRTSRRYGLYRHRLQRRLCGLVRHRKRRSGRAVGLGQGVAGCQSRSGLALRHPLPQGAYRGVPP